MNIKTFCLTGTLLLLSISTYAQKKKEAINDSNTPLHLLQPEYKVPYKALSTTEVKTDIDRILRYLEKTTHTRVVSEKTGKVILDADKCVGCHLCMLVCPAGAIEPGSRLDKKRRSEQTEK